MHEYVDLAHETTGRTEPKTTDNRFFDAFQQSKRLAQRVTALEHEKRLWHDGRVETMGAASTSADLTIAEHHPPDCALAAD